VKLSHGDIETRLPLSIRRPVLWVDEQRTPVSIDQTVQLRPTVRGEPHRIGRTPHAEDDRRACQVERSERRRRIGTQVSEYRSIASSGNRNLNRVLVCHLGVLAREFVEKNLNERR